MGNNSCDVNNAEILQADEKIIYDKLQSDVVPSSNESGKIGANITNDVVEVKINQHNFEVLKRSEEAYIRIVEEVVNMSGDNLTTIRKDKSVLRDSFVSLFCYIIKIQLVVLFIIFGLDALLPFFDIAENIIITYMSAVFVETLGVIAVMIAFAFKSNEEIKIIDILNSVVSNYQKYKEKHK